MVRTRKNKHSKLQSKQFKTSIKNAFNQLEKLHPSDLEWLRQQIEKKVKDELKKSKQGPKTPAVDCTNDEKTFTTPEALPAIDCLKNVEKVTKSTIAKNSITTRRGRRKLTEIYNKMRVRKKDKQCRSGTKLRKYDADGRGDERFETAYKLMFVEGFNANKAALKVVGKSQQNAFRISFGKCSNVTLLLLITSFAHVLITICLLVFV